MNLHITTSLRASTPTFDIASTDTKDTGTFFKVHFDDQGGGHYAVLDLDGCSDPNKPEHTSRLSLDPQEWLDLAKWMAETVAELDAEGKR